MAHGSTSGQKKASWLRHGTDPLLLLLLYMLFPIQQVRTSTVKHGYSIDLKASLFDIL